MSDVRYCIHGKVMNAPPETELGCGHGCVREASEAEIINALGLSWLCNACGNTVTKEEYAKAMEYAPTYFSSILKLNEPQCPDCGSMDVVDLRHPGEIAMAPGRLIHEYTENMDDAVDDLVARTMEAMKRQRFTAIRATVVAHRDEYVRVAEVLRAKGHLDEREANHWRFVNESIAYYNSRLEWLDGVPSSRELCSCAMTIDCPHPECPRR